MNYCPKCGARVTDEMFFCYKCGGKLTIDYEQQPQPPANTDMQPPPLVSQYKNSNPMEVPPPPTYRMNLDSSFPPPNISPSNHDSYLPPNHAAYTPGSTNFSRTSRVTDETVFNPQLSTDSSQTVLTPPPVTPGLNTSKKLKRKSFGNFLKKANPFKPVKHFLITLLILGGIWAGSFFFDDISGADHDVIFEWDITRNAVVERLNYQSIKHSTEGFAGGEIIAEIFNSSIDFPIKKDLLEDKKLVVSYLFNSNEKLRSISIIVPQIKRDEIYPLSLKIGESYTFDPTNSNPDEYAYITDDTKIWLIVRNETGENVDAIITLTSRQIR